MLRNYLKIAIRNLRKQPGYTGINIVGLALGMACCIFALLFLRQELGYNQTHENLDDIYRVRARFQKTITFTNVPDPMVPAAITSFPDVVNGVRLWEGEGYIKTGAEITEEDILCVDAAFFEVFSFPMKAGFDFARADLDATQPAANDPRSVILSEPMAVKYFGSENPIGQSLELRLGNQFEAYSVVGVAAAQPVNSSITFDIVLPFENVYKVRDEKMRTEWGSYGVTGFLQLRSGVDTVSVHRDLLSLIDLHHGESIRADGEALEDYAFFLQPLSEYHLGGQDAGGYGLKAAGNPKYVYLLVVIAGLVLLIACFNFMNLSIGQASSRLREIGVRKAIGAERKQLIQQFSLEAFLLSLIAMITGYLLALMLLPLFNGLTDQTLALRLVDGPGPVLMLLGIVLLAGLLAGAYPALVLSGVQSISAFKGKFQFGGGNLFTRTLVVLQFSCTIAFLIATVFMSRQHDYMRNASLGFDDERVIIIPTSLPPETPDHGEAFLSQMKQVLGSAPNIVSVSGTSNAFTMGNSATMRTLDDGTQQLLFVYRIDDDYLSTLDLQLKAGRNFSDAYPGDANHGIIVNEAFAKVFDLEDPVGASVPEELVGIEQPRIIGVVEDFHFRSLHNKVEPVFLHQRDPYKLNYLLVKVAPGNLTASIATLRAAWDTLRPDQPFAFHFMDEVIDAQYRTEEQWAKATTYASWIAILIACLGLLGLTSLTMMRRTKEVGIRKVLGASVPGLVGLLTREFAVLVVIANLIAWPAAYFLMRRWLEDFPYRIDVTPGVFIGVALFAIAIAMITISFQCIRAATLNPVQSLRSE